MRIPIENTGKSKFVQGLLLLALAGVLSCSHTASAAICDSPSPDSNESPRAWVAESSCAHAHTSSEWDPCSRHDVDFSLWKVQRISSIHLSTIPLISPALFIRLHPLRRVHTEEEAFILGPLAALDTIRLLL